MEMALSGFVPSNVIPFQLRNVVATSPAPHFKVLHADGRISSDTCLDDRWQEATPLLESICAQLPRTMDDLRELVEAFAIMPVCMLNEAGQVTAAAIVHLGELQDKSTVIYCLVSPDGPWPDLSPLLGYLESRVSLVKAAVILLWAPIELPDIDGWSPADFPDLPNDSVLMKAFPSEWRAA